MHGLARQPELLIWRKLPFRLVRFYFNASRTYGRRQHHHHHKDSYDYTDSLQRCKTIKSIKSLHAQIIIGCHEQNPFLNTKLVSKYVEYGKSMEHARKVFDGLSERDVFMWNVVIQGYASLGPFIEALNLYNQMRFSGVTPNRYTFPFVFKACGAVQERDNGESFLVHVVKYGFETDLFVGNGLVSFYAKCNEIDIARKVFDEMPKRDIVSWNSMISGYTLNGFMDQATMLLQTMVKSNNQTGLLPDNATLVTILPACAKNSAIQAGYWIHSYIIKSGMEVNAALGSGLISMYANCGRVNTARDVFDNIVDKNVIVWSAMIRCYGIHGYSFEALDMFSRLIESDLNPDSVIFLCLLSTCSHAGMVEKGKEIYQKMEDYGVEKRQEHYACMVDLFGRSGLLDQAVEFIENMPVRPGKDVYGALLGACRIHNAVELAEEVAEKLFVLDPDNAGRYVIMANMYEDGGEWEKAARVRRLIRERKIRKPVGCSSIEVDCVHHTFGVEDESHPLTDQIFYTVETLNSMRKEEIHIII